MIAGLIAGIIIGCSALAASVMFKEEGKIAWTRAGTLFALAAIITTVASKVPAWIAMLLLLVVLAMMGYLVLWWMENGSIKRELVAFAIMMPEMFCCLSFLFQLNRTTILLDLRAMSTV